MQPVEERALAEADFVLSIVPPGDALHLAKHLAPVLTAANMKPVYVECNAVSPPTMLKISDVIAVTGCAFVGAGIMGPPPRPGSTNTKIYASGPAARDFAKLNDYGLIVRVLDGPLTAASALKMSYAGITKGTTALGAMMMLAATRNGAAESLRAELERSQPALLPWFQRAIPAMFPKAYRFVGEMDEIADFVGEDPAAKKLYEAISEFYTRLAKDFDGPHAETDALADLLKKKS